MVNLASCTLGAAIISLPYAFASSGIVVAFLLLGAITAATVFSIHLLVLTGERTGYHSYEDLARHLIGYKCEYFVGFLMWFFCFGCCVAYVIALGDLFQPFVRGGSSTFFESDTGLRIIVTIVWFCVMLPLSLPQEINSLRYFSLVAVTLIAFFVCVMVYHCARYGLSEDHFNQLQVVQGGVRSIEGISLFMFAFMCQVNAFEVYFEMHPRTVARMTSDVTVSMSVCCLLYITAGFFGYFDFLSATADAVLKNYNPRTDVLVAISYIGITFKLCVGFSLCMQPARDAVFFVFNMGEYHEVPRLKRMALCAGMAVAALLLGLYIPKINVVFGLLGSFIGGLLGFMFPAVYAFKGLAPFNVDTVGRMKFYATWALFAGGLVAFIVGTAASVLDIAGVS